MNQEIYNQINNINSLQANVNDIIMNFISNNLSAILKEITNNGGENVEYEEEDGFHINLGNDIKGMWVGEPIAIYELIYNEENGSVQGVAYEYDDYIDFFTLDGELQMDIINWLIGEFNIY